MYKIKHQSRGTLKLKGDLRLIYKEKISPFTIKFRNFLLVVTFTFLCGCANEAAFHSPEQVVTASDISGNWQVSERSLDRLKRGFFARVIPESAPTIEIEETGYFKVDGFPIIGGFADDMRYKGASVSASGSWDIYRMENGQTTLTLVFNDGPKSVKSDHILLEVVEGNNELAIRYWLGDPDLYELLDYRKIPN